MVWNLNSVLRHLFLKLAFVVTLIASWGMLYNTAVASNEGINVNTASQSELESIKGIGPARARAIITARDEGGIFQDSDDLQKRVRGIGSKSVEKLIDNGLSIEAAGGYRDTKSKGRTEYSGGRRKPTNKGYEREKAYSGKASQRN